MKRSLLLLLAILVGCSALSRGGEPETALKQRLERQLRVQFDIPPAVPVEVGALVASDFPGYDTLKVKLGEGDRARDYEFLLSKDRKTLVRMAKFDVSTDPWAENLKKIDIAGRPIQGAQDAKVVIVNFDDYQCPYCARLHTMLFDSILKSYGDSVKLVYKDFPVPAIHPWAMRASVNANCLASQSAEAYWNFTDHIHRNQKEIGRGGEKDSPEQKQAEAALDKLALEYGQKNGVDQEKLRACIAEQKHAAVESAVKEGDSLGVDGTPTMFINGEKVVGAVSGGDLRRILDRHLREVGVTPPSPPPQEASGNDAAAAPTP